MTTISKNLTITALISAMALVSANTLAADKAHWGYQGKHGPEHWGEMSESFAMCSQGKNQSPINIQGAVEGDLPKLEFNFAGKGNEVVNNGHTIQVNFTSGSSLTVAGHSYALKQFHFHAPSENTVNGKHYPLEAHFVHADEQGNLAVVAKFFEQGEANKALAGIWQQMPKHADEKASLNTSVSADAFIAETSDYYRFTGSLTTPPCSEGVAWFVLPQAATASAGQIEAFKHTMHHDNNRPVQPINARIIVK